MPPPVGLPAFPVSTREPGGRIREAAPACGSGRAKMAKGQAKSNKEVRKPKAPKPKKQNVANPSTK